MLDHLRCTAVSENFELYQSVSCILVGFLQLFSQDHAVQGKDNADSKPL